MKEDRQKLSFSAIRELFLNARRITRAVFQDRKWLIIGLGFTFVAVAAGPFLQSGARSLLINELVRIAGSRSVTDYLLWIVVFLILATVVPAAFVTLQKYLDRKFWFFIQEKFELMILKKRGDIDVALYEDPKKNDLFQKVTENGVWRVHNFTERQFYLFQSMFEVAVAAAILITAKWWLFFIILVTAVPELILEARYGQAVWGIFHGRAETRRRYWDLRRHFEWLPELIELKIFQNLGHFFTAIRELMVNFHREELSNEWRRMRKEFGALGLGQAGIAFAVIWFILEAVQGELKIGTLTFFLASVGNLRQALSGFFLNLGRQYQDSLFVTDVFRLLDLPPAIKKPAVKMTIDPQRTPEIVFDRVTFSYPGTEKMVLRDFSLTISPGEKIALVGKNGAGKTTLVKLLCRFYDPTDGRITIGGHNLRALDLESWYDMVGALFQDYANYHFLVKEAIAVGRTGRESSLEKIKGAARASEADLFIEEWEKAYEQMLGKQFTGGIEPSIGQWQKLALARTFYRDPRVLILDEPTSSIDAESEAKIFEKLEELPRDRTVILISHRFSTVRQANRICVIDDGRLSELGTHEELLARNGTYAHLFRLQARGYQ